MSSQQPRLGRYELPQSEPAGAGSEMASPQPVGLSGEGWPVPGATVTVLGADGRQLVGPRPAGTGGGSRAG